MRKLFLTLLFALTLSAAVTAAPKDFPTDFPDVFKKLKMEEIDSKQLAPGVTYYRYYFEDFTRQTGTFCNVDYIYLKHNPNKDMKSVLEEIRTRLATDKTLTFAAAAAEKKLKVQKLDFLLPGSLMWQKPMEDAVAALENTGDVTPVIECDGGYYLISLAEKHAKNPLPEQWNKKFPVSLYFVVVDWDKANVSFKLAESGMIHQTVEDMIKKDKKAIAGVNGAYFHYKPFAAPYYPLKINGKYFEPPKGYDSKQGMMFDNGCFPVIDHLDNLEKYDNCIMGYYLMKNGKISFNNGGSHWHGIFKGSTPHTAVGLNRKTKKIVLLVSDGRFPKQAPGLNLYSSCYFLKIMGCDEALTIDGGGSCQMLIKKGKKLELQNCPSDNGKFDQKGARRVHSCIYLVKGGKKDK